MSIQTNSIPTSGVPLLRGRLALVIEATWLAGLILVPLVFRGREWVAIYSQPKYFLVHLSALVIIVAWTAEWALGHSENWSMGRMFDGAGGVGSGHDGPGSKWMVWGSWQMDRFEE